MDPLLSRILSLVPGAFGEFDGVFRSYFCRITWNRSSRIRILTFTNPIVKTPSLFAPPLFDLLMSFPSASRCRGFLQKLNRRGISLVHRAFLFIAWSLWGFVSLAVSLFCLRMGCRRRRSSFSSPTLATVSRGLCVVTETTWVCFQTVSLGLPLKSLSHFPRNVGFFSFLTLGYWSSFHNFAPNSEISSSHHLIILKFYRHSSIVSNFVCPCV